MASGFSQAQFDFLVGDWYVEIPAGTAEGNPVAFKVDWTIRYILDGWALQDTWRVYDGEDHVYLHGTMFRTYSKERKTWKQDGYMKAVRVN